MTDKKESVSIILTLLLIVYIVSLLFFNKSLFNNYFVFPTSIFLFLYSYFIPINKDYIDEVNEKFIQFSSGVITIIIAILTFVLVQGESILSNINKNKAFNSICIMIILLFSTTLFSILQRNTKIRKNKIFISKITFFTFLMFYVTLMSFIAGLAFN